MMKFISPLSLIRSRARKFILNLNQYRNTHYRILNNCKIEYKKFMEKQIASSEPFTKVFCLYKVYANSKRNFDLGNVCAVHEKFFEDALVELGRLPDDNINYIPLVIYMGCGIDKENPRVEIEVVNFCKEGLDYIKEIIDNRFKEELENE